MTHQADRRYIDRWDLVPDEGSQGFSVFYHPSKDWMQDHSQGR